MEKLVLIDGNSLLNRAFYATPVFSTKDGKPTNAIFGFTKLLLKILSDLKPEYLVIAFDLKAPTFRHKMYDGYKATRKGMPEELAAQVEPLKSLLAEMNVAMCSCEGYEADDIIGTLSARFNVHSYIYTGDRDSYQLVDDKTDVYFTKRGVTDLLKLNKDNFKEEVGLEPWQIIDLKSLMGDSSDNIPGITGIGEKTARDLISRFGSLDGVYSHTDELKGGLKSKIENGKEMAYLSYTIAKIDRDSPIEVNLAECKSPNKFSPSVKKIFMDFEFKSLIKPDLFEEASEATFADSDVVYPGKIENVDYDKLKKLLSECEQAAVVAEKNCTHIFAKGNEYVIKLSEDLFNEGLVYGDYIDILNTVFDENHTVILYDCKSVLHLSDELNVDFRCNFEDLSVVKYLCDVPSAGQNLKTVCEENLLDYSFSAFCLYKLYNEYKQKLALTGCEKLYEEIEKPLIKILYNMEKQGVRVSKSELDNLTQKYGRIINELTAEIYSDCGCEFNINSPAQLGNVLFEKLGLKSGKKGKNGKYSTNAEILEKLADDNPVVAKILKYRQYQKLLSTYLDGFKPFITDKNMVHTTYNQTITTTGRLSSANPNLQNIPIREDEGRELRKIFIPREGNVFIDADYSQIELRLLAHFSGCKELIEAYNSGQDIHSLTASQVFGVDINDVTPKMRREAKAVNFGIIYGISDFGLSKNLKIPYATAKEYIEKYFATYSSVKDYMNANVEYAKEHGYVCTLTGRRRIIPEIKSPNANLRQFGERAAMNMPLQGSSADIIKIAMIGVDRRLKKEGMQSKLILQVHDELVLDCPESEAEKAGEILKYEMENAVKLSVPMTVEVHCGKNWYDAK
ncbi:MAG: DNA polymerase I [Clostridia bacterium]|nr:DNA polymerase I [Clostridia bacterium]